jgi:hypothetical protein
LIRHACFHWVAATPIFSLAVAMIEPSLWAPLVPSVGTAALLTPGLLAATGAAISMPAITGCANEKHRVTLFTKAYSLPENRCALNRRHASSQAALDNSTRFVAG